VQSSLTRNVATAFGAAIALLLGASWAMQYGATQWQASERQVSDAHEVRQTLQRILSAEQDIETGARGFALSGADEFLEPYVIGRARLRPLLDSLTRLLANDKSQRRRIQSLRALAEQRARLADSLIQIRRGGGHVTVDGPIANRRGKIVMDQLRAAIREMDLHARGILSARDNTAESYRQRLRATIILGNLLALVLLGACAWRIRNDVVARLGAEMAVVEQKTLLESILANIGDGVVAIDARGAFRVYNPAAKRMIGLGATNTAPSDWAVTYGTYLPDTTTPFPAEEMPLMRALRGESPDGLEMFIRPPNAPIGQGTWISCTARPLRDAGGEITGAVVAIQDVTARKHADEERRHYTEELARSNAELQQFAYVASHDLQEPLRMVASYTQLLAKRYTGRLDADADEFIAFAVDGATRMQRLITDLLAYSRVGSRGKELRDTSSEEALALAVRNLHAAILDGGAAIVHTALPRVLADESQLTQLFQNLIANAIKFRGTSPAQVEITAHRDGPTEWVFVVRDNGIGIDEKYFDRVFVMFQRLHATAEYAGSGIGLAICKRIVERHGGQLWVQSAPGMGSAFFFTMQAA
jgi:signal transduction histidine kinase/CHASE3 domain sensor protein